MAGNRKAAMKVLIEQLSLVDKPNEFRNVEFYKSKLSALSDELFDAWIVELEEGREFIYMTAENFRGKHMSFDELLAVGDLLGIKHFEQLVLTDHKTGLTGLTPEEYPVGLMTLRRQSQSLMVKASFPVDNKSIDTYSDQPTGDSKAARLSFIEMQILNNQGIDRPIEELIGPRGGNLKAMANLDQQIIDTGMGSLDAPGMHDSRVKSQHVAGSGLLAMHLDNRLGRD